MDEVLAAVAKDIQEMTCEELQTAHEVHRNGDIAVALRELRAPSYEDRFLAEHGHRLAVLLNIHHYDVADRDALIMEKLRQPVRT